jgi:hypothetical protein
MEFLAVRPNAILPATAKRLETVAWNSPFQEAATRLVEDNTASW